MNETRTQRIEQLLNNLGYMCKKISAPQGFSFDGVLVTKPQVTIFFFVGYHQEGVTVKDIAAFLNVTNGAVTQFIDALVAKNLVKREEDTRDRRLQRITLTEFAKERFEHYKQSYYASLHTLFDKLTDKELQELHVLLEKLNKSDNLHSC
jgi:DNA-binding MarR family transcriptional regulator